MSTFFLAHQDPTICQAIRDAITQGGYKLAGQTGSGAELMAKIGNSTARILLLQVKLSDGDSFPLVSQVQARKPGLLVVPILQGNEAGDVWQKIFQLGLRDVLLPPFTEQNIGPVLTQTVQHVQESNNLSFEGHSAADCYMVAVAGARSGVGKSIVATNLAVAMARLSPSVTLVDYGMNAGDFFTMLDQVPRNTMADAISQGMGLDVTLLHNLVADHSLGFKFLACPNDDFDYYGFDLDQATNMLKECRALSDYLIVDTGVSDLPPTTAAVREADLVYLVTTRDLARLMATQRWIKNIVAQDVPKEKLRVILNNSDVGSELKDQEIEEILLHPVTAHLPSCPAESAYSINSGRPMTQTQAEHPFVIVMNKLAEYTVARWSDGS